MGLISGYKEQLVGKIFIFHAGEKWLMGKIVGFSESRVIYKPLGRSKAIVLMNPDSFGAGSNIDTSSRLTNGSCQLEKYLELFGGIDQ